MLSIKQAAAHADVCESVVRAWVKRGLLPHYRLSASGRPGHGKITIAVEDLDAVVAGFKVTKKEPEQKPAPAPAPVTPHYRHVRLS